MTTRALPSTVVFTLGLCLLMGCVRLERSHPQKDSFLIQASRPGEASSPLTDEGLRVLTFSVSPLYEGKGFVYKKGDNRVEADFYNEFFLSPGTMLTEEVREWMAGSGLFSDVAGPASHGGYGYYLEGRIGALYGDYRDPSVPKAVLEMEFIVSRNVSAKKELIFRNGYPKEIFLDSGSPKALVNGWSRALQQILVDFEEDLRGSSLCIE